MGNSSLPKTSKNVDRAKGTHPSRGDAHRKPGGSPARTEARISDGLGERPIRSADHHDLCSECGDPMRHVSACSPGTWCGYSACSS